MLCITLEPLWTLVFGNIKTISVLLIVRGLYQLYSFIPGYIPHGTQNFYVDYSNTSQHYVEISISQKVFVLQIAVQYHKCKLSLPLRFTYN